MGPKGSQPELKKTRGRFSNWGLFQNGCLTNSELKKNPTNSALTNPELSKWDFPVSEHGFRLGSAKSEHVNLELFWLNKDIINGVLKRFSCSCSLTQIHKRYWSLEGQQIYRGMWGNVQQLQKTKKNK